VRHVYVDSRQHNRPSKRGPTTTGYPLCQHVVVVVVVIVVVVVVVVAVVVVIVVVLSSSLLQSVSISTRCYIYSEFCSSSSSSSSSSCCCCCCCIRMAYFAVVGTKTGYPFCQHVGGGKLSHGRP